MPGSAGKRQVFARSVPREALPKQFSIYLRKNASKAVDASLARSAEGVAVARDCPCADCLVQETSRLLRRFTPPG
jgi:hypothetical protein